MKKELVYYVWASMAVTPILSVIHLLVVITIDKVFKTQAMEYYGSIFCILFLIYGVACFGVIGFDAIQKKIVKNLRNNKTIT